MKRVVIKVGSSSLVDESGSLSSSKVDKLVTQLAALHQSNLQVILVTSGAVAAGVGALKWNRLTMTMPEKQAAAAVGQSVLIQHYQNSFSKQNIPVAQLLLTRSDIEDRKRFVHIRNTIEPLLHHGIIPIINENDTVAVEEIRFGDNDTLGALVSLVAAADLYVMLSDIDGLYTANPRVDKNARLLRLVDKITSELWEIAGDNGSSVGTGGMKTKLQAAQIATQSGVAVHIANSSHADVLQRIVSGDKIGTHFIANTPLKKKKPWIAYGTRAEGSVVVDNGAFLALTKGNSSLLLAGIMSTAGDFLEGSIVEILHEGKTIGKGIVHFSKRDIDYLLRKRHEGEPLPLLPEVIHRDQFVLLTSKRSVPSCSIN